MSYKVQHAYPRARPDSLRGGVSTLHAEQAYKVSLDRGSLGSLPHVHFSNTSATKHTASEQCIRF